MESTCRLRTHPNYQRLVGLTEESHSRGRASAGISKHDIALARLYSHSFRGHVIGAFHATNQSGILIPADYVRKEFTVPAAGKDFYRVRATTLP
jgi:hypothetical protein